MAETGRLREPKLLLEHRRRARIRVGYKTMIILDRKNVFFFAYLFSFAKIYKKKNMLLFDTAPLCGVESQAVGHSTSRVDLS